MRAVIISAPGGPDVLQVTDVPEPYPESSQVTIDVAFAAVGFADVLFRRGEFKKPLPFIPGLEVAGKVRALGKGVEGLRVGQLVVAMMLLDGGYAEVARARAILTIPLDGLNGSIELTTAAASVGNATTAYLALTKTIQLRGDETVLVLGATGGLGSVLGQMARRLGASRVLGTVGNASKRDYAKSLGYDDVLLRDDFTTAVNRATVGRGVDLVLDPVGGLLRKESLDVLRPFGRLVVLGSASGSADVPVSSNSLWLNNQGVLGFSLGGLSVDAPDEVAAAGKEALGMIARGEIQAEATDVLPLEQAGIAHRQLEQRLTTGKLVLRLRN
jgi:NADPH:quinone reductase-like Zn-dependent oxidoreductase